MSQITVNKAAELSYDGLYRYRLSRWWGDGKRVAWLMMNPSTADAFEDDATIRKCMGFARTWGYDGIEVINQFSLRSRDPKALLGGDLVTAIGEGAEHIHQALQGADTLVCAWGCESVMKVLRKRGFSPKIMLGMVAQHFPALTIVCLGKSKSGNPYHPLMLPYSTERQLFA